MANLYEGRHILGRAPADLVGRDGVHTITVPAGQSSGSVVLVYEETDDPPTYKIDFDQEITARLGGTNLAVGVVLTLVDNESRPALTLSTSDTEVNEGESFTLTLSYWPAFPEPSTHTLTYQGPGGAITNTTPISITFAAQQRTKTVTINTANDTVENPDRRVTFRIGTPPAPFTLGADNSVTVTIRDNDGPPLPPGNLRAEPGDRHAVLTWDEAPTETHPVQNYYYRARAQGAQSWNPDWTQAPGGAAARTVTVTGLTNGVRHTFQVRAENVTGQGDAAEVSATPAGPPGRPSVNVSARDQSLVVTWSVLDDGGRQTDLYQVQWKPFSESSFDTSRQRETTFLSYTIPDLENGTLYSVRVRASNDGGETWGNWSQNQIGIPEELPAPRKFRTQWPTQTSITMRWFPVEGTTEHILEYRRSVDGQAPSEGDWSGATRVTGHFDHLPIEDRTLRPVAVAAGLDCETRYDFRLTARTPHPLLVDLGGLSPYVYVSEETGECAQNDRITNLLVTNGPQCVTLSWTAPSDGRAVAYRIDRYIYVRTATEWVKARNWETLTGNHRSATYRDCSPDYRREGGGHVYRLWAITAGGEEYAQVLSQIEPYEPFSVPNDPRNIRLTEDNQNRRSMAWDPAPDVWVTTVTAAREGRMRNSVVRDPWPTTYVVERALFEYRYTKFYLDGNGEKHILDGRYVLLEDSDENAVLTGTMTVGEMGSLRGFDNGHFLEPFGALTTASFTTSSGESYTLRSVQLAHEGRLVVRVSPAVPQALVKYLTLVIGDETFEFADAGQELMDGLRFDWYSTDLSWTTGQNVSLKVMERVPFLWKTMSEQTGTSYTDNQHAGGKTYVYRILAYNDRGRQWHDFWGDWLWDSPILMDPQPQVQSITARGVPTITGTAQAGQTLTADTSGISDGNGMENAVFSYQWMRDDADMDGETGRTYELSKEDVGRTIKVRVTFRDDTDGEESATSASTAVVTERPNRAPTGLPTISGTAQVGETLTADASGIADADGLDNAVFSYQWIRDDADIAGETAQTYELAEEDVGKTFKVRVTFTDDREFGESVTSARTPPVWTDSDTAALLARFARMPAAHDGRTPFTFRLQFSEEVNVGWRTLEYHAFSVTGGAVTGPSRVDGERNKLWNIEITPDSNADVTVSLPVTTDCAIQGAICTADGKMLSERVEHTVAWGVGPNSEPTGLPAIAGTVRAGQTLTADALGIADPDGLDHATFSYQWMRDDADIAGETGETYEVSDDDVGKTIRVRVAFTDDAYNEETVTSEATAPVASLNSDPTGLPVISGTAQVGQTLTADVSGIADADGLTNVSYSYQWMRGDADIAGETAQTYEVSDDDVGKSVKVRVTFTDDRENEETLTSAATASVEARPNTEPTGLPVISGTAQAGHTLTADTSGIDDADGLTNVSYSYQWVNHNTGADIAGATASAYQLSGDDVGWNVKVRVTFTDDRRNEETLTSEPVAAVQSRTNPLTAGLLVELRKRRTDELVPVYIEFSEGVLIDLSSTGDHAVRVEGGAIIEYRRISNEHLSWYFGIQPDSRRDVAFILPVPFNCDDPGAICSTTRKPLSEEFRVVAIGTLPGYEATGQPTITGAPEVGRPLTADTSGISDDNGLLGVIYKYQWVRVDGEEESDIEGATARTYTPVDDDEGSALKVRVTFKDNDGYDEELTSEPTGAVSPPVTPLIASFVNEPQAHDGRTPFTFELRLSEEVEVSFRELENHVFTVSGGSVTSASRPDGETGNLRWVIEVTPDSRDDVTVVLPVTTDCDSQGAICTSYGKMLVEQVEFTVVVPNSEPTGLPAVNGTAQVGQTLTADTSGITDADGLDHDTFSYQWMRSDGNGDADIAGETGQTYELSATDVGKTIRVRVTFTDDRENKETLTSAATAAVEYVAGPPGAPLEVEVKAGDAEIRVSWQAPAHENRAPVEEYRVRYREEGGSDQERLTTGLSESIDGLTNGVTYVVVVEARNAAGYGTSSDELRSAPRLAQTVAPDTPEGFTADAIHHLRMALDWDDVEGADHYEVQFYDFNTRTLDVLPFAGITVVFEGSSAVVDNLPEGRFWWLQVRAVNAVGASEWTELEMFFPTRAADWENNAPTGLPTISGTVQAGQTLTASTSGIDDEDGLDNVSYSYQWVRDDADIAGATARTYEVSDDDVGNTIRVRVTFTDDRENQETLTSAATAAVQARPNVEPTGLPTITGTAQAGQTLTASTSGIDDEDGLDNVSYSYQWMRDDADIAGETAQTYDLTDDDVGKTIRVRVTFTDDREHEETLTSAATAAVEARKSNAVSEEPAAVTAIWSATLTVGAGGDRLGYSLYGPVGELSSTQFSIDETTYIVRLVLHDADKLYLRLSEDAPANLTLHIGAVELALDDASPINGLGDGTYQWPRGTVSWSAEDEVLLILSRTGDAEESDSARNSEPTGLPTITGTAQAGQTLTADISGIDDEDGLDNVTFAYQWMRDDADLAGETAQTYDLTDDDVGKTIKVKVSFTDDREHDESLTSAATAAVEARPNVEPTGLPTITGTARAGQTLTASTSGIGDADGLDNVSYSYQWMREDADIAGETNKTYEVTDDDVDKTIKVRVTFTDDDDNDETLTSVATAAVEARPNVEPTGLPTISGTAQAGETLTASTSGIGDEDGLDNAVFSYQWIANDGNDDADIAGATARTYEVSDGDVGKTIKVRVTFTDDAENAETLTSAATAAVEASPTIWSATMTVGAGGGYLGYSVPGSIGELSSTQFSIDETAYTVWVVVHDADRLYFRLSNDAPEGLTLHLGDLELALAGATVVSDQGSNIYRWHRGTVSWSAGDKVPLSLSLTGDEEGSDSAQNTEPTGLPVITGTARAGRTLTADVSGIGDADGLDNVTFSYQWIRSDQDGDAHVAGETARTYELSDDDVGKTIKVRVTFTDDADNKETLTSEGTETVTMLLWSATLTAGSSGTDSGYLADGETGAVSEDEFSLGITTYRVKRLTESDDGLLSLSVDGSLPTPFTLHAGAIRFASEDATTLEGEAGYTYQWDEGSPDWSDGERVEVALTVPETPLALDRVEIPETHRGSANDFTFELHFSEEVSVSYLTLRDHAFTVTGGTVGKAQRLTQGSNVGWRITVTPDSDADVTVVLPVTTDCDATGAICTGDGRKLSNSLSFTVSGPPQ